MNKNSLLNQNYICPMGADGVQEFLRQEIVHYAASCSEFSATMASFLASIPGLADESAEHA